MYCGFFHGIPDRIQDDLGGVRRIFRQGNVIERLGIIDLLRDLFDGRLDQREHGGDGLIQIGEADGIDPVLVHRNLHFQIRVVEREGGCIDPRRILPVCFLLLSFVGPEHNDEENDQDDAKGREYVIE